jgi:ribosomal protein S12 methylthiotransferase
MTSKTIHFVSLGCPKNRVDSEIMLGVATRAGYRHVQDAAQASVIVVNTCGFIDAAKQESIETIVELAQHKQNGTCKKLVVTGCLSQRHPQEIAEGLPEVDHVLGSSDMPKLERVLAGKAERILVGNPADWLVSASDPRQLSTRGASAYVKIAEGCDRKCSFCVIPRLRGRQRSRAPHDVIEEVRRLADAGVVEVNLISQDTVSWGRDLGNKATLARLVERVADVSGIRWVRLFYLYPDDLGDELIELMASHPRVVPYVDMPLQHAADAMLRRMRRGHGGARLRELVGRLRERVPGLTFRTAFIVGHPGETEAEFEELLAFVRWARFERLGVFRYSDEESSRSHELEGKVTARVAATRAKKLMGVQRKISREHNRMLVGQELTVLVEGPSEESELVMVGRHAGQAPEIDGVVVLSGAEVYPGQMRRVRVTKATDYDLLGEVIDQVEPDRRRPAHPGSLVHHASDGRRVLRLVGSRA